MNMPPHDPRAPNRRRLLQAAARMAAAVALPALARPASAEAATGSADAAPGLRALAFVHTHTRERIALAYASDGGYEPAALQALNRFLRDHYSGAVGSIDPQVFDLLHRLRRSLGSTQPFEVISGYRSPATNAHLRDSRGGGVARDSLHVQGRAIDVRLPGVALADLRDAAIELRGGGVGYYPASQFVHIDTGRVRRW